MSLAPAVRFDLAPWTFVIPESAREQSSSLQSGLNDDLMAALEGGLGTPFRRSRHATTWKVLIAGANGEATNVFVKQLDAPHGLVARDIAFARAKRCEHVLRICDSLRSHGFGVPSVLLTGENRDTGSEIIVTSEAPGFMVTRWMNPVYRNDVNTRRRILRRLGEEVARLHKIGYIHGDLTPYNVFATDDVPPTITFIDHEGTEKTSAASVNVARSRMRNLMQLGHFDIPGLSATDKLRVFASYAAAIGWSKRAARQALLRLAKMIERRRKRDRLIERRAPRTEIIAGRRAVRG